MSFSAIRPTRFELGKRDAGIEQHVDGEGALVEGRQERARQQRGTAGRDDDGNDGERHEAGAAGAKRASQQRAIGALERAHEPALALLQALQARAACSRPSPASA